MDNLIVKHWAGRVAVVTVMLTVSGLLGCGGGESHPDGGLGGTGGTVPDASASADGAGALSSDGAAGLIDAGPAGNGAETAGVDGSSERGIDTSSGVRETGLSSSDGAAGTDGTASGGKDGKAVDAGGFKDGGTADGLQDAADAPRSADVATAIDATVPRQLPPLAGPEPTQTVLTIDSSYVIAEGFYGARGVNGKPGDVFVLVEGKTGPPQIAKFVSGVQAWMHISYPQTGHIAVGDNEEVFFGGYTTVALPGETQTGPEDAIVGKLNPDGTEAWAHQWGTSTSRGTSWVAAGPNGSVIGTGTTNGPVPSNTPAAEKGPFLVRYEADGTRTFLTQFAPVGTVALESSGILVDPAGNSYLGQLGAASSSYLLQFDPAGNMVSDNQIELNVPAFWRSLSATYEQHPVAWAPGHTEYYEWTNAATSTLVPNGLFKMRLDGTVDWYRLLATRKETTDVATGTIWTGDFKLANTISVTSDSIYLAGTYSNISQAAGSAVRDKSTPGFVGRYDLEGNLIWIQEFATAAGNVGAFLSLWPDVDGDLMVTMNYISGISMFKLRQKDGTLK